MILSPFLRQGGIDAHVIGPAALMASSVCCQAEPSMLEQPQEPCRLAMGCVMSVLMLWCMCSKSFCGMFEDSKASAERLLKG